MSTAFALVVALILGAPSHSDDPPNELAASIRAADPTADDLIVRYLSDLLAQHSDGVSKALTALHSARRDLSLARGGQIARPSDRQTVPMVVSESRGRVTHRFRDRAARMEAIEAATAAVTRAEASLRSLREQPFAEVGELGTLKVGQVIHCSDHHRVVSRRGDLVALVEAGYSVPYFDAHRNPGRNSSGGVVRYEHRVKPLVLVGVDVSETPDGSGVRVSGLVWGDALDDSFGGSYVRGRIAPKLNEKLERWLAARLADVVDRLTRDRNASAAP